MPAKSKAQFRLLGAVLSGKAKETGMTKKQAREMMEATTSYSKLPEKKKKKKK